MFILSPIPILLCSLADHRWLTFYIIVLAKLYDNLCKREDEKEYYKNYYENDEDGYNEDQDEEGDKEEPNDEQT